MGSYKADIRVFYEIAMSIGNSLDLNQMLEESLSAYLRKLNFSAATVFLLKENPENCFSFDPIYSVPNHADPNHGSFKAVKPIPQNLNRSDLAAFLNQLPIQGDAGQGGIYHILNLPDFGLLLLLRQSEDPDGAFSKSLIPLNRKLAKACIAYEMTERQLLIQLHQHNPVDRLVRLADANIPVLCIHGDADTLVPLDENSEKFVLNNSAK